MKRTIFIIVLLTALAAMGQSRMQAEKTCYQRLRELDKDSTIGFTLTNHYDPRTGRCFIREFHRDMPDGEPFQHFTQEVISDAFEMHTLLAVYLLRSDTKPDLCFVHETNCKSQAEFDRLVKQQFGF
jgi:hypothetical protein